MQGSLEGRLRALPGVLECSLNDAGVALLIHPEVDARVLQAKAQAVFAEFGDGRPLMIMGGLPLSPVRRVMRFDATPLSLAAFAIAVLCLLALIPLAPRPGGDDSPPAAEPVGELIAAGGLTPELFRPVASYRPRTSATAAFAAPAPASAPAPVVEEKAPKARPDKDRSRRPAAAQLTTATMVAKCEPGRSGGHRAVDKKPLPQQSKGAACG